MRRAPRASLVVEVLIAGLALGHSARQAGDDPALAPRGLAKAARFCRS
jgi:hypothetical protein